MMCWKNYSIKKKAKNIQRYEIEFISLKYNMNKKLLKFDQKYGAAPYKEFSG